MDVSVIQIGNSKGIRLSKSLLNCTYDNPIKKVSNKN